MKIKCLDRPLLHKLVSQQFSMQDGSHIMWMFGKLKDSQENCIFAACGSKEEVQAWVEQISKERGMEIRKEYAPEMKDSKSS